MARRGDLFLSKSEIRAETLRRVNSKGRANLSQAAIILGVSQPTLRAYCDRGELQTIRIKKLRYLTVDEIERAKGIVR